VSSKMVFEPNWLRVVYTESADASEFSQSKDQSSVRKSFSQGSWISLSLEGVIAS